MANKPANPFDEFDARAGNPFDEFDVAPPPPAPTPDESAAQWGGVLSGALAPYATAAALGGAAGLPLAGVGAPLGAAAGVLSLGLGDIGTSLYNAGAPLFGGERVALPSETIRNQFINAGLAKAPETPGQRVAADVVSGLAGAIAQPAAMGAQAARMAPWTTREIVNARGSQPSTAREIVNMRASQRGVQAPSTAREIVNAPASQWNVQMPRVAPSTTREILNMLASQRAAQAGAGAGAAAAPSIAQNYFDVNDPLALTGLSLAGGMAGGRATAARPSVVTREQLARQTENAYAAAEQAGVNLTPQAMTGLKTRIDRLLKRTDYDPSFHPLVKRAAKIFEVKAGAPMTFKKLEEFRRTIRDLPYSEGGGAAGSKTERAMIGQMSDAINDYMMKLSPAQTTSGDTAVAAAQLSQARNLARRNFEADLVEEATKRAASRTSGSTATNLMKEFGKIADKPRRMQRLTPETQAGVKALAEGKGFGTAASIGKFAPRINLQNLSGLTASGAGAAYFGHPEVAVAEGLLGGGALVAKGAANRIATGRANKLASTTRGTPEFKTPYAQIGAQTAQQIDFPAIDPATGQVLLGVGVGPSGERYPMYGELPKNRNSMRR